MTARYDAAGVGTLACERCCATFCDGLAVSPTVPALRMRASDAGWRLVVSHPAGGNSGAEDRCPACRSADAEPATVDDGRTAPPRVVELVDLGAMSPDQAPGAYIALCEAIGLPPAPAGYLFARGITDTGERVTGVYDPVGRGPILWAPGWIPMRARPGDAAAVTRRYGEDATR